MIINGTFKDIIKKENQYESVILDLRNMSDKKDDRDFWIQFRGLDNCEHIYIDENGTCDACGAYYNPVGLESDSVDFYNHIYTIIQSIDAKNIMLITDRFYPADFVTKLFNSSLPAHNKFIHCVNKIFISQMGKLWSYKVTRFDKVFITMFSNTQKYKTEEIIVTLDIEQQIALLVGQMPGIKTYFGKSDISQSIKDTNYLCLDKVLIKNKRELISIFDDFVEIEREV